MFPTKGTPWRISPQSFIGSRLYTHSLSGMHLNLCFPENKTEQKENKIFSINDGFVGYISEKWRKQQII